MSSLTYWSDKLGKTQARVLTLDFSITDAATSEPIMVGAPVLSSSAALASQAAIDAHLGTTSEFLLAAFDATSMGADAFGGVVNMGGQVAKVVKMVARCHSGTAGITVVSNQVAASSALTGSSLSTQVAKGADGNIGFRVAWGNTPDFDALTAGTMTIEIHWISK